MKLKKYLFCKTGLGGHCFHKVIYKTVVFKKGGSGGNIVFTCKDNMSGYQHITMNTIKAPNGLPGHKNGTGSSAKSTRIFVPYNTKISYELNGNKHLHYLNALNPKHILHGGSGQGYPKVRNPITTHVLLETTNKKINIVNISQSYNEIEKILQIKKYVNHDYKNIYTFNNKYLISHPLIASQNIVNSKLVLCNSVYIVDKYEDLKLDIFQLNNHKIVVYVLNKSNHKNVNKNIKVVSSNLLSLIQYWL